MKEYFEYTLKTPIKISKDGEYIDASDVVVYAPRPRDKYRLLKLEADLNSAFLGVFPKINAMIDGMGNQSNSKSNSNDQIGIGSLIIQFADGDSVGSIMYNLEQIFLAGTEDKPTITIDGVQMKKTHFDDGLHLSDLKALAGGYADHFLSLGL